MERGAMIVAGFGFRSGASLAALRDALVRAGGADGVTHLATLEAKAEGLVPLGLALGLPVVGVADAALRAQVTLTQSGRVQALKGVGSVAEAAALAAAGPGARLRGPRVVSADGTATAAIAEGLA
jgi:cobalt-precorrin 5A hydrolase